MEKDKLEKQQQSKEKAKFNSVTQSDKVKNQNQTHNVRKEGVGPKNNFN